MTRPLQRLLLVLFGVSLLAGGEGVLRLLWTPAAQPGEELSLLAIDPFQVEQGLARTDPAFRGVMRAMSFAVPKPAGRFRIFCLGGSTTMGYPSPPEAAWPAVLERRFRALYPGRDVEVINVGGNSYGTGRVLAVLRGILKYEPDLVIVATGDTEFVEDSFRTALALQPKSTSWLHQLYLSRALKLLLPRKELSPRVIDVRSTEVAGFVFSPMPDNTVYQVTAERRRKVESELAGNLAAMVSLTREKNLPLLLSTLPANLVDWAPVSDPARPSGTAQQEWENLWRRGQKAQQSRAVDEALKHFDSAARLWDGHAGFCYEYGRLLLQAGRLEPASQWLRRARDLDPTPVRSTSTVQSLVRQAAAQGGCLFADPAARFEELSFGGVPSADLFFDYAHPTPRGHAELASVVARAIADGMPGLAVGPDAVAAVDAAELARAKAIVLESGADLSFVQGALFERQGQFDRAAESYRKAIAHGNRGEQVRFSLAKVLTQQGAYAEALEAALALVQSHPQTTLPFGLLGYLYERTGQSGEALAWCRKALSAGERNPELLGLTSRLFLQQGDLAEARKLLQEGLERYPGDCRLQALYGELLERGGELGVAEAHYRKVLSLQPACQQAWEGLGLTLMNQGRWQEAADTFIAALRQPDPLPFHHLNLGIAYAQGLGNTRLAAEQFQQFLRLQPEQRRLVPPQFRQAVNGR